MQILTTRFGLLTVPDSEVITFPAGIVGFETCRRWVLLADVENTNLAWLQSVTRSHVALALVNPRRFAPQYRLRISRRELDPLKLARPSDAEVLAIVGRHETDLTLNLKAPLVFNVPARLGRQVIANGDQPVRLGVLRDAVQLRQSA